MIIYYISFSIFSLQITVATNGEVKCCVLYRVLVLVPTRELGVQVYQVSRQLAQFTNIDIGLSVGGLDLKTQVCCLYRKPCMGLLF